MTTDVVDRLAALSPAPAFPAEDRRKMLDAILATDRPAIRSSAPPVVSHGRGRRRVLVGAAAAGVAAAIAVGVPVLAPTSVPGSATPAAAAELHRLANLNGIGGALRPGQFAYRRVVSTQTGVFSDAAHTTPARTITDHSQTWYDTAGDAWVVHDRIDSSGKQHHEVSFSPAAKGLGDLTVLPTDPAALDGYLRSHATGSASADEAVFAAVTPILGSGVASPALRAAAVDVLAKTEHVILTKDTVDADGRHVERFDFVDPVNRPNSVESFYFDPDSGAVLQSEETSPGSRYLSTVSVASVTDSVPTDVRRDGKAAYDENERLGGVGG